LIYGYLLVITYASFTVITTANIDVTLVTRTLCNKVLPNFPRHVYS